MKFEINVIYEDNNGGGMYVMTAGRADYIIDKRKEKYGDISLIFIKNKKAVGHLWRKEKKKSGLKVQEYRGYLEIDALERNSNALLDALERDVMHK